MKDKMKITTEILEEIHEAGWLNDDGKDELIERLIQEAKD